MKYNLCLVLTLLSFSSISFAQGIAGWQASAESAGAGYIATDVSEPIQVDIGAFDVATNGGVTYEFIYNVAEIAGASSAFMGSLNAPEGASAGLKLDQWPNSGTFGATAFGVADYTSSVSHVIGADTHVVFVADGTDLGIYVNGEFAETMAGASVALSGLTGIGHAYNHNTEGSVDALGGTLLGVAVYDTALSADVIGANFTSFVPEPASGSLAAILFSAFAAALRSRRRM